MCVCARADTEPSFFSAVAGGGADTDTEVEVELMTVGALKEALKARGLKV